MNKKEYICERVDHWQEVHRSGSVMKFGDFYRRSIGCVFRYLIPEGSSVLEVGCGQGDVLNAVKPGKGVGIDFSPEAIQIASRKYSHLEFICEEATSYSAEEPFDIIILSDILNDMWDVQELFQRLQNWCHPGNPNYY